MPQRYACLVVPSFPVASIVRSRPDLAGRAVAVTAGTPPAATVVDGNRRAWLRGVRPAMALSHARACSPNTEFVARNPSSEQSAHAALLETALGVSPRIEAGAPGVVTIDLRGGGVPSRDERRLATDLVMRAEGVGLTVCVSIASTRTAAWIMAACEAVEPRTASAISVVPHGKESRALSPLPTWVLVGEGEMRITLDRWGVETLGRLAALPDAALIDRLGAAGRRWQRLARGEDLDPFVPYRAPTTCEETVDLEWPIESLEALAFVLRGMLDRLMDRLGVRGWALGAAHLTLGLRDRSSWSHTLAPASPLLDRRAILPLLMHAVGSSPPRDAIERVTLVGDPSTARVTQSELFSPALASPDRLAATMARLETLVGRDGVGMPRLLDTYRPDGWEVVPFSPAARRGVSVPGIEIREDNKVLPPLRRVHPPVEVRMDVSTGGTPVRIVGSRWGGAVRVAVGPWRSSGEWWNETSWATDEWDVEPASGGVIRLVRDHRSRAWVVSGVYD